MAPVTAEPELLILCTQLWWNPDKKGGKATQEFPQGLLWSQPWLWHLLECVCEKKSCMGVTSCSHNALQKTAKEKVFLVVFWFSLHVGTEDSHRHLEGDRIQAPRSQSLYGHTSPVSLKMVLSQHSPQPALPCFLAEITTLRPNNYILHNVATSQTNKSFPRKSTCFKLDLP